MKDIDLLWGIEKLDCFPFNFGSILQFDHGEVNGTHQNVLTKLKFSFKGKLNLPTSYLDSAPLNNFKSNGFLI